MIIRSDSIDIMAIIIMIIIMIIILMNCIIISPPFQFAVFQLLSVHVRSAETLESLTKRAYALSSFALTCKAPRHVA